LLQIKAAYKAEIINNAEYLNTKYKEKFVNIFEGQESNHTHMNSTIKIAAVVVEELNPTNESSETGKEGFQHKTARLGDSLK
jgi:hypothetical protein